MTISSRLADFKHGAAAPAAGTFPCAERTFIERRAALIGRDEQGAEQRPG